MGNMQFQSFSSLSENDEKKIRAYVRKIQPLCEYSLGCQAVDGGTVTWVQGEETDLENLFAQYRVPENFRDKLAERLNCNNCGETLGRGAKVGIKSTAEIKEENRLEKLQRKYELKLKNFGSFLEQYPYLGLNHRLGQEICMKISAFPQTRIEKQEWWRAIEPDGSRRVIQNDFFHQRPPRSEGRFNHYGQSVFYCSSDKTTTTKEVADGECLVWVQQFTINQITKILDLTHIPSFIHSVKESLAYFINVELSSRVPSRSQIWKPEYFISRFIADCAREKGFKGIKFDSVRNPFGENLVLFDWGDTSIQPIGHPTSYELQTKIGGALSRFNVNL